MSKTTNMSRKDIRWQLLVTVSVAALLASAYDAGEANAASNDSDRPLIWIELGGQLEGMTGSPEIFSPPFMASITQPNLLSVLNAQKPPSYAIGDEARITFQPENSDWVFSAGIQYGRSGANRHRHQQTANKTVSKYFHGNPPYSNFVVGPGYLYPTSHAKFADSQVRQSETHTVLDFQAGKDVGLGLLGGRGSSILSAGVRFAQFTSKSKINLHAEPDVHYPTAPIASKYELIAWNNYHAHFHDYGATATVQRSFRGVGPSLAWNASVPFAGDTGHGELSFDWGINGAVLFGRQRASGRHKTEIHYYQQNNGWVTAFGQGKLRPGHFAATHQYTCHGEKMATAFAPASCRTNSANFDRARTIVAPNLGGTVGLSYRIEDFKVSFGYKADFFFNAMDGGIDTRKTTSPGFFGPYASISVGLGD